MSESFDDILKGFEKFDFNKNQGPVIYLGPESYNNLKNVFEESMKKKVTGCLFSCPFLNTSEYGYQCNLNLKITDDQIQRAHDKNELPKKCPLKKEQIIVTL